MKNDLKISLLLSGIGTILIGLLLFFFLRNKITIRCFKQDKDEKTNIDEKTNDNHEEINIDNNQKVAKVTNNTINVRENMIVPVAIAGIAIGGVIVVVGLTAGLVAAVHYRYYKDYHKSDKELRKLGLTALIAEVDSIISECLEKINGFDNRQVVLVSE